MRMNSSRSRTGQGYLLTASFAVVAMLLAGCSGGSGNADGGEGAAPSVASVARATATPSSASVAAVDDLRPLDRPDTSATEQTRMYQAWYTCLYSHGVPKGKGDFKPTLSKSTAAAEKACAAKEPEDWMERMNRQHPQEYLDKARDTIRCMQAKSDDFTVSKTDDPLEIDIPDHSKVSAMLDLKTDCEQKAFKVKYATG